MPAQLESEEERIRQEREKAAAERRERNALAIAEVVGRNPARPSPLQPFDRSRSPQPGKN